MSEFIKEPDLTQGVDMRITFLESHCVFLQGKIDLIGKLDPGNPLLIRYARELREAKGELSECIERRLVLVARSKEILKSFSSSVDDLEAEKEMRREMLKTFGVGLLNSVLEFVPDEQREAAITAASDFGEVYPY